MSGTYANENKLVERGKLHIRGGACIIRVSNALGSEHARYQLWPEGRAVPSPKRGHRIIGHA